jgi:hypothetical protein
LDSLIVGLQVSSVFARVVSTLQYFCVFKFNVRR